MVQPTDGNQRIFVDQLFAHGLIEQLTFANPRRKALGLVRATVVHQHDAGLRWQVRRAQVGADFVLDHLRHQVDVVWFVVERGDVALPLDPVGVAGASLG